MADKKELRIRCDALGCNESHPLDHEALGEPSFGTGRWLGWVYLDLNRPDLYPRELRFCSVFCCQWWLEREVVTRAGAPLSPLDTALRAPHDEIARSRAGLAGDGEVSLGAARQSRLMPTIQQLRGERG